MSYLLESLKRLEENRRSEQVSDLLAVQGEARRDPKKRPVWPYVVSAALLANAGVAVWWLTFSPRSSDPVVSRPPVAQRERTAPAAGGVSLGTRVADNGLAPAGRPGVEKNANKKDDSKAAAVVLQQPLEKQMPSEAKAHPIRPVPPSEPAAAASRIPPQTQRTPDPAQQAQGVAPAVNEPSAAVNNGLPELKISLHSYSAEPRSRLVRINDMTLGEGDTLPAGIKVEEITPDGVVLSRDGRRFYLRVEQSR